MKSPLDIDCVVLNQSTGPVPGICFKLSPKSEFACLYNLFLWARSNEKGEVKIAFTHHVVTLKGLGLQGVVEQLSQQRVAMVRVASRAELLSKGAGEGPIVESILVEQNAGGSG